MWILVASAIGAKIIADNLMRLVDEQYDVLLPEPEPLTVRQRVAGVLCFVQWSAWSIIALAVWAFWTVW